MDEELLLTVYFLRHQESVQNAQGFGESDTELTLKGRDGVKTLTQLVTAVGPGSIGKIVTGTLKRHQQTTTPLVEQAGYTGEVVPDGRVNAFFSGKLLEQPAAQTQTEYDLERFKANDGILYVGDLPGGRIVGFDPRAAGVFPFDPLFCRAYFDRDIRELVFPGEATLFSFEDIEFAVTGFQTDLIAQVRAASAPLKVAVVSSSSPSGFNLEYAAFGTIGQNMFSGVGSQNNPVFPQGHDEVMVLGYTRTDLAEGRERLRVVEGNVKIPDYLKKR